MEGDSRSIVQLAGPLNSAELLSFPQVHDGGSEVFAHLM